MRCNIWRVKKRLTTILLLAILDGTGQMVVDSDASDKGLGCVLSVSLYFSAVAIYYKNIGFCDNKSCH